MKKSAPRTLSAEARRWWVQILAEYDVQDAGGLLTLQTALEAFDRMRQAQRTIREEGPTVLDRWRQRKPHPLLNVERDARAQMLMALKALNLDLEPTQNGPGRPPGR